MTFYEDHFGDDQPQPEREARIVSAEATARDFLSEYSSDNYDIIETIDLRLVALVCGALLRRSAEACRCTGSFICTRCKVKSIQACDAAIAEIKVQMASTSTDTCVGCGMTGGYHTWGCRSVTV